MDGRNIAGGGFTIVRSAHEKGTVPLLNGGDRPS